MLTHGAGASTSGAVPPPPSHSPPAASPRDPPLPLPRSLSTGRSLATTTTLPIAYSPLPSPHSPTSTPHAASPSRTQASKVAPLDPPQVSLTLPSLLRTASSKEPLSTPPNRSPGGTATGISSVGFCLSAHAPGTSPPAQLSSSGAGGRGASPGRGAPVPAVSASGPVGGGGGGGGVSSGARTWSGGSPLSGGAAAAASTTSGTKGGASGAATTAGGVVRTLVGGGGGGGGSLGRPPSQNGMGGFGGGAIRTNNMFNSAAAATGATDGPSTASVAEVASALSGAGLVAVLDLCVALYKFVNIELHSQGWYAVRVRVIPGPDAVYAAHTVITGSGGATNSGMAGGNTTSSSSGGGGGGGRNGAGMHEQQLPPTATHNPQQSHGGLGSNRSRGGGGGGSGSGGGGGTASSSTTAAAPGGWHLEGGGGCCLRSSVFRIRYCYEEVKLQTAVMARLYVSNLQALPSLSITLEYELLFHESSTDSLSQTPSQPPSETQLRPVARERVCVSGLTGGLTAYHGCTFSDEHFGLAACGLFAGLAGFATREQTVASPPHRVVGSSWLCSLVGEGPREGPTGGHHHHHYRASNISDTSRAPSAGGTPRQPSGLSTAGSIITTTTSINTTTTTTAATIPTDGRGGHGGRDSLLVTRLSGGPPPLDFGDQELRKKLILIIHQVVEAPSIKHGVPHIPSETERLDRLAAVFELLAGTHRRSRDYLATFLRAAPAEWYAPQNLDVLRALLASAAAASTAPAATALTAAAAAAPPPLAARAATSPLRGAPRLAAHAGSRAGGGTTHVAAPAPALATVPSGVVFRTTAAGLPTTAAALQVLDDLLRALSVDSSTDWSVLGWVVQHAPQEVLRHLKLAWEAEQPGVVEPFVLWDTASARDVIAAKAAEHRQLLRTPSFPMPPVRPEALWGTPGEQPVLVLDETQGLKWLQERETHFPPQFRTRDETHVAIFVHGFQGASTDLCLVKAHLALMYPYLECFSSKTNEGNTHDSLQEMGKRLAVEMAELLAPFSRSTRRPLRKITLVGHSIGNLILRAALMQPELVPYKPFLWLYISVCGPHLGFLYGSNAVVDTGLLLLKSIGKGKCLHQLTFSDAPRLTDCYLYRLAHECPLSVFKLVIAVSSPQDRYVPYHSSAITTCPQAERDSRRGRCYGEMLRALTAGVGSSCHLFRLAVDFSLRTKSFSFSKLVGRTAHIEFIESQLYVGLMMWGLVHRYGLLAPAPHSWL